MSIPLKMTVIASSGLALVIFLLWPSRPTEKLPESAKNVHFSESSGWQYWNYCLRFDANPKVCRDFAIELMIRHGGSRENITERAIQSFDLGNLTPAWMKIASLTNGTLISCNNGWIKTVVDHDRGRLYYRGFN